MAYQSRILIVDDEEPGRDILENLLRRENYQLFFAADGLQALEVAQAQQPDLILLDIMMPEIDGYEVCRRLRHDPNLSEVPVLMLTALDDRDSRLQGIEAGADDFLSKPFDRIELRLRIRTILRLNRYRRLVNERSRFAWVVDHAKSGYLSLDTNNCVVYCNQTAVTMLEFPLQMQGLDFFQHLEERGYKLEPEQAWQQWREVPSQDTLYYLLYPETVQNAAKWIQVNQLHVPGDPNILLQLHDVSQQMNLQHQMWSFQALISHKLRSPLNGLAGLQLLDEGIVGLQGNRAKTLVHIARISSDRLQNQIMDILRFVDSSQLLVANKKMLLQDILAAIPRIAEETDITHCQIKVDPTLPNAVQLNFSPESMEMILRELFNNAYKFHPQHQPHVEVCFNSTETLQTLSLTVQDDGTTLAVEDFDKVWLPYYQSEKSFTAEVKGMGLGLAAVARMVINKGGHCDIRNRQNTSGIIVNLTLPFTTDA